MRKDKSQRFLPAFPMCSNGNRCTPPLLILAVTLKSTSSGEVGVPVLVVVGEGGVHGNAVGFAAQISFPPPDQYISASKLLTVVARVRFPSEPFAFSLSVFVLRRILCPHPPAGKVNGNRSVSA